VADAIESPRGFGEFLGNARVVEIVRRALAFGKLPHAMILAGPDGVGKRTFSLLLAQALNCLSPREQDSCGECRSCRKIRSGAHPDVRVVVPEGANIKIDQIRALNSEIAYQPFEGKSRVAVLDPADQLRPEAANCLLKTLEEPPSRTVIILVTPNPHALLTTIRSRCRLLTFGALTQGQVEEFLATRAHRPPSEARLASMHSEGSVSAALLFDTSGFQEIRSRALEFLEAVLVDGSFDEVSRLASAIGKEKEDFQQWIRAASGILESLYFARVFPSRIGPQPQDLEKLARSVSHSRVLAGIRAMRRLAAAQRFNANRQIALESLSLEVRAN
jgi:DNA polymerase-3 subunit delta'